MGNPNTIQENKKASGKNSVAFRYNQIDSARNPMAETITAK
jgi:hypothetical protein